jgi:hypothetical protein
MTKNNIILLAGLGGALIGGSIAALATKKIENKRGERFPLSPATGLNDLSAAPIGTNIEQGSIAESKEVFQTS